MSGSTQVLTERRAERGSNCFIGGGVEMRQEWQAAAQRQREQARQLAAETLAAGDHVSSVVALHAATIVDEPVGAQRYSFDFRHLLGGGASGADTHTAQSLGAGDVGIAGVVVIARLAWVGLVHSLHRVAPL